MSGREPLLLRALFRTALLVTVVSLGTVVIWWQSQDEAMPPIHIPNATATWVSPRAFDIKAPAYYWNDTCKSIWVNWWVQTRHSGNVAVTTEAVTGPFSTRGKLPPSYKISITPMVGPPIQLRVTIPKDLPASEVVLVGVDDTVPDDEPCESGWSGVMQVFRLEIAGTP